MTGNIVWIHGPFLPGLWTDSKIFKHGMMKCLDKFERVEADSGYKAHDPKYARTPHSIWNKDKKKELRNRVRARHETVNGRFKIFGALHHKYRNDWKTHGFVFRAVAVITHLSIKMGEPLFHVPDYNDK